MGAERIERLPESDKVARDQPGALMDQLIERMLAVGPRFAPVDRPCCCGDRLPVEGDVLAVALHRELLEIGREAS